MKPAFLVSRSGKKWAPENRLAKGKFDHLALKELEVFTEKRLEHLRSKSDLSFDEWIRTEKNLPQSVTNLSKNHITDH